MDRTTYTVVGTSVRNGQRKLRYSNGDAIVRGKTMLATGNTEIALFDLPAAMTKAKAQQAFDELFRKRTIPTYSSPCFDYNTIGNTNRTSIPESGLVHRALQFIQENK